MSFSSFRGKSEMSKREACLSNKHHLAPKAVTQKWGNDGCSCTYVDRYVD